MGITEIRTAGRDFYQAYVNSPGWRKRRNLALDRAGWRCSKCGAKNELQVHHRTYERLGAELDSDLDVLCAGCHEGHHHDEGAKSHLGLHITLVRDILRSSPELLGADLMDAVKARAARLRIAYRADMLGPAIDIALGKRGLLRPSASSADISPEDKPPSKAEAYAICRELRLTVPLRSIPKAKPANERGRFHARQTQAFAQLLELIEAQSQVCNDLEESA